MVLKGFSYIVCGMLSLFISHFQAVLFAILVTYTVLTL